MQKYEEDGSMPIAVIGMGCRFPGDATSPDKLWELLVNGRNAWSEIPKDRINVDGFYHPSGDRQGSISFKGGHFLKDDVATWDAPFFSATAHEAAAMDPQQRILLEVSYEAFENAGIPIETLPGTSTGVYCGSFVKDYEQICLRDPDYSPQYAATGNGIAIMSNRVSWFYDLKGPSMTLDTGCSASLVGVHLACQSLRTGESTLAIAMGAGLILTPSTMLPMTALNFLSPDGKCFAFDERANGYGRGEGIGAVVLKPLKDALRDNDTIRAVIRGSGVNQDGRTPGITMPSKDAQAMNIRAVYNAAGLGYDRTAFFEAHGTGTQAGDPTELGAISETFAETRDPDHPIFVGSVKTNIGHLEGCAGIAGLVKGVLMLEKGLIPPNLYFENVNPRINLDAWKIKIPKSVTPWPMEGLRRVSINCFGFGGTNAHIILDDAAHYLLERGLEGKHSSIGSLPPSTSSTSTSDSGIGIDTPPSELEFPWTDLNMTKTPKLYVLSSHEESGIDRLATSYVEYFGGKTIPAKSQMDWVDLGNNLAYTLASRRTKLPWRAFVVSSSPEKLRSQFIDHLAKPMRSSEAPVVAFVFSGQGSQWFAMGRELLQYQPFLDSLEEADRYLKSISCEWSLIAELLKDEGTSRVNLPRFSQPLCTALQVALVGLLQHWGVEPSAVVGHSSGEIAAAYTLGAISRQDSWKLAYHRGRLTSMIKFLAPKLKGRMMTVALSEESARNYIARLKKGTLTVACINSPENVTVSGDEDAIFELEEILLVDGVFARLLKVENAYHSFHMKTVERHYLEAIKEVRTIKTSPGKVMFSSVTGKSVASYKLGPSYWAQNLVSPVRFSDAMTSLIRSKTAKTDLLLEIGPHAVLQAPLKQILDVESKPKSRPTCFSMLYRGKDALSTSLEVAGNLWIRGYPVELEQANRSILDTSPRALTDLPLYPWNHTQTYWHESHLGSAHRFRKYGREDLIGAPTADSIPFEPRWRGFIRVSENPWVQDHQVQNTIIYPAAGMMAMVLQSACQMQDSNRQVDGYEIAKMNIEKAMIVPSSAHGLETALNVKIRKNNSLTDFNITWYEFSIYSKLLGAGWIQNCDGLLAIHYKPSHMSLNDIDKESVSREEYKCQYLSSKELCTEMISPRQLYETLESIGMKYGPMFQNITSVRKKENVSCTTIQIPDTKSRMPAQYEYPYLIHPATLDAMFQTVFVAGSEPMVPSSLESIFVSADFPAGVGEELEGYSSASRKGLQDAMGTIVISDASWSKPLLVVKDLHFKALSTATENFAESGFLPNHHNLCAGLVWKENFETVTTASFTMWIALLTFKYPDLNILETRGGRGVLTANLLKALGSCGGSTPRFSRYTFTDANSDNFEQLQTEFLQWSNFIDWKVLNLDGDIAVQGFKNNSFDILIAYTSDLRHLTSFKRLLKPKGRLLFIDRRDKQALSDVRLIEDAESPGSLAFEQPNVLVHDWGTSLEQSGFSHGEITFPCKFGHEAGDGIIIAAKCADSLSTNLSTQKILLLLPLNPSMELDNLSARVQDVLLLKGFGEVSSTRLVSPTQSFTGKLCLSLLEIDAPLVYDWTNEEFDAFRDMVSEAQSCLWITRGGQVNSEDPSSSLINTLFRTIRSEDPQKSLYTLDLDKEAALSSDSVGKAIISTILASFDTKSPSGEMEYAERGGKLMIPRIILHEPLSSRIDRGDAPSPILLPFAQQDKPLQLAVGTIGDLDSLRFNDDSKPALPLGPNDIEIKVEAVGVSKADIETTLGQSSNETIGSDVAGIVSRVGLEVTKFNVGDRVATIVSGAFKTFSRNTESMVQLIPDGISFEATALLPTSYSTAYYSVIAVGRLQEGESILIHDAAGTIGQAAIQMAKQIGAEVYVTVGSSDERERLIHTYGLKHELVFDYNSTMFDRRILRLTAHRGVDLVLNTPGNVKAELAWNCVTEFGIFIDIGGNTGLQGTAQALRNVCYTTVSLDNMHKRNTSLVSRVLQSTFDMIRANQIQGPMSVKIFDVAEISQAFKEKQAGAHSVVVRFNSNDIVPVMPREPHPLKLDSKSTYVLIGGLGGLGRSLAGLMVKNGAKNLAFFSRSGATSKEQKDFLEDLKLKGVNCRAYACDICDRENLAAAIKMCTEEMSNIRGVIQAAAVIKDSIFDNMTYDDWITSTRPKIQGSWNLHKLMPESLDFFVFLSSSAGIIGARGQGNYAVGNTFQDALAQHRRTKGLSAVSLDLGLILGAGMVAEDETTLDMLRASGFFGIREKDFHIIVSAAMTGYTNDENPTPPQVIIGTGTGGLVKQNQVSDPYWYRESRFSHLKLLDLPPSSSTSSASSSLQELLTSCTSLSEASSIILEGLVTLLAKSMNMLPADLDTQKPANAYGVDSLVAVGTRNWIFREVGVDVSVFEILSEGSMEVLATGIAKKSRFVAYELRDMED